MFVDGDFTKTVVESVTKSVTVFPQFFKTNNRCSSINLIHNTTISYKVFSVSIPPKFANTAGIFFGIIQLFYSIVPKSILSSSFLSIICLILLSSYWNVFFPYYITSIIIFSGKVSAVDVITDYRKTMLESNFLLEVSLATVTG